MSKDLKYFYGDKVKTGDNGQGTIKFIGEIAGKEGLYYGIDLTKGNGKNNGSLNNITYFKTRGNGKSGRFTKKKKLKLIKNVGTCPYTVGDRVLCTKSNPPTNGLIRYVGIPSFLKTSVCLTIYYIILYLIYIIVTQ